MADGAHWMRRLLARNPGYLVGHCPEAISFQVLGNHQKSEVRMAANAKRIEGGLKLVLDMKSEHFLAKTGLQLRSSTTWGSNWGSGPDELAGVPCPTVISLNSCGSQRASPT